MRRTKRKAVLVGAVLVPLLCMGADNPFDFGKPSRSELAERVETLEKQNAELNKQVADLSVKVDLLTQRVNTACGGDAGTFSSRGYSPGGAPPSVPGLEVVRLKPEAPKKPRGRLIIQSSGSDDSVSLVEHNAPLPGTNYVPLPDPAESQGGGSIAIQKSPEPVTMAYPENKPKSDPVKPISSSGSGKASYDAIKELVDSGDLTGAAPLMEEYLSSNPGSAHEDEIGYWLGEHYFAEGEYEKAITFYRKVYEGHVESRFASESLYKIGLAYLELGRTEEAADALEDVKVLYPFSKAADKASEKLVSCCQ